MCKAECEVLDKVLNFFLYCHTTDESFIKLIFFVEIGAYESM